MTFHLRQILAKPKAATVDPTDNQWGVSFASKLFTFVRS